MYTLVSERFWRVGLDAYMCVLRHVIVLEEGISMVIELARRRRRTCGGANVESWDTKGCDHAM